MINFLRTSSANYALVQEHILGLIKAHLAPDEYSETVGRRRPGALNFSLFIDTRPDVLMSHGVADKNYFWRKDDNGNRLAADIKCCLVPGAWLRRRIANHKALPHTDETIYQVGWPRLDALLRMQAEYEAQPKAPRPKVLWAPSHDNVRRGPEQATMSSYPAFLDELARLEKHADVVTSLHPRNREQKQPTVEQLIEADVVISDFGTMLYEAWALGKPVIFPDWIVREPILEFQKGGAAEKHIYRENIGIHAASMDALIEAVHTQRQVDEKARAFIDDYIDPQYRGSSAKRVADVLRELDARHSKGEPV
jgi:UDP-N-acetylglucosamine 2-epimerase